MCYMCNVVVSNFQSHRVIAISEQGERIFHSSFFSGQCFELGVARDFLNFIFLKEIVD